MNKVLGVAGSTHALLAVFFFFVPPLVRLPFCFLKALNREQCPTPHPAWEDNRVLSTFVIALEVPQREPLGRGWGGAGLVAGQ